ncbi:DUF6538 domain-containing protein [Devosia sp.]|uniref:DUF6538 domain-containing protein n=1 Tax=Devosia sp. TaxID=1871048 RepID=UPI0025BA1810|nr:DUF6538 domain-containing protein [Devosia sp.]
MVGTNVGTHTMPAKGSSDKRFLEKHGDQWRVTIAVPRHLHGRLGTRLKQSLQTDSLTVANRLKWAVIDRLRERIEREMLGEATDPAALLREALLVRKDYEAALDPNSEADIRRGVEARAYEILGPATRVEHDDEGEYPIYDPKREELARTYTR